MRERQKGEKYELTQEIRERCGVDSAQVIQMIEIKVLRGSGCEHDPFRQVVQYWTFEGKKIADIDPFISSIQSREHL